MNTSTFFEPLPAQSGTVLLRRFTAADAAALRACRADPELGRYQGWRPMSEADALSFCTEMQTQSWGLLDAWLQIVIARAEAPASYLGDLGLYLDASGRGARLGYTLIRSAQGQGLATAAVQALLGLLARHSQVEQIEAAVDVRNLASLRLLERCGWTLHEELEAEYHGERCVERVYRQRIERA